MTGKPEWTCPDGAVCPTTMSFKAKGPCDQCRAMHADAPFSCGKVDPSPREWRNLFRVPAIEYAPPQVQVRSPVVPIIYSQISKYRIPERFPEIDAWAVPVHKCMDLNGKFRSSDLKDYLGIPSDRKLILSTVAPDPFMEMLWDKGESLDLEGRGIDYWFPAHFSIYDNDGKCYHYFNAKRQQVHSRRVKSSFMWFRLGPNLPVSFLQPIHGAGSVIIACQHMYSSYNRAILRREVHIADQWFGPSTSFFFVAHGGLTTLPLRRKLHFFNSRWLMLGLHGRTLRNLPEPRLSLEEILVRNLEETISFIGSAIERRMFMGGGQYEVKKSHEGGRPPHPGPKPPGPKPPGPKPPGPKPPGPKPPGPKPPGPKPPGPKPPGPKPPGPKPPRLPVPGHGADGRRG